MDLEQILRRLGAAEAEIVGYLETEIGTIVHHRDGSSYVLTPGTDGAPAGVAYLHKPHPNYAGTFPVFAGKVPDGAEHPAVTADEEPGDTEAGTDEAEPADDAADTAVTEAPADPAVAYAEEPATGPSSPVVPLKDPAEPTA